MKQEYTVRQIQRLLEYYDKVSFAILFDKNDITGTQTDIHRGIGLAGDNTISDEVIEDVKKRIKKQTSVDIKPADLRNMDPSMLKGVMTHGIVVKDTSDTIRGTLIQRIAYSNDNILNNYRKVTET